jgi:hypothetical protein
MAEYFDHTGKADNQRICPQSRRLLISMFVAAVNARFCSTCHNLDGERYFRRQHSSRTDRFRRGIFKGPVSKKWLPLRSRAGMIGKKGG